MTDMNQSQETQKNIPQLKPWQIKVACRLCGDIVFSRYSGEFRWCKCGEIAIDSTPYYTRYIGEPENFIEQED